jgi:hypothetical protein
VTSSDAPQPPGGPLREDAPEGGFAPDAEREDLPAAESGRGSDDSRDVPPVSHEDEQSEESAALQAENAETSQDQPSQ